MGFERRHKPLKAGLNALNDVVITSVASGEIIKFDGTSWINNTLAEAGISAAAHTHAIDDLTDVVITSAASGDLLSFNGSNWVNGRIVRQNQGDYIFGRTDTGMAFVIEGEGFAMHILEDTAAPTDESRWRVISDNGNFEIVTENDAGSGQSTMLQATRTTGTIDTLDFAATDVRVRSGNTFGVYDSDNSDNIDLTHNGSVGKFFASDPGINGSMNLSGITLGDDASGTVVLSGSDSMIFVACQSGVGSAALMADGTGLVSGFTGANVSVGASGTDPNVDGDANYWITPAGTFHINNRLGLSRSFTVMAIVIGS